MIDLGSSLFNADTIGFEQRSNHVAKSSLLFSFIHEYVYMLVYVCMYVYNI